MKKWNYSSVILIFISDSVECERGRVASAFQDLPLRGKGRHCPVIRLSGKYTGDFARYFDHDIRSYIRVKSRKSTVRR